MGKLVLKKVKDRTGVITGNLRRNWKLTRVTKVGGGWAITIYNNVEYVIYVENGHRTKGGRWVDGQFMLLISVSEIADEFPEFAHREFNKFLDKCMEG